MPVIVVSLVAEPESSALYSIPGRDSGVHSQRGQPRAPGARRGRTHALVGKPAAGFGEFFAIKNESVAAGTCRTARAGGHLLSTGDPKGGLRRMKRINLIVLAACAVLSAQAAQDLRF